MQCRKCNGQIIVMPVDEKTSKRVCQSCGHSEIIESRDAQGAPGRRMLTDDMEPGGSPLVG